MKNYINIFTFALFIFMLHSCKIPQKIQIMGEPGTEIYSPTMQRLGVIDNTGKAKIKLSRDGYFAYLMSHNTASNMLVPFALDYKYHNYIGTRIQAFGGLGLAMFGSILIGTAAIAEDAGDDDVTMPLIGIGAAAAGLGVAVGLPAEFRRQQTQYEHDFKYLSYQQTNQDISFSPVIDNGEKKLLSNIERQERPESTTITPKQDTKQPSSTVNKTRGSISKRTITDYGKQLAGTYTGSGALSLKGSLIEEYKQIKVVIKRIDKNNVTVEVIESGESFFSSKSQYGIKKRNSNSYTLSMKDISAATIDIDSSGNMEYVHPKVNIDGELYTLKIFAKR